MSYLLYKVAMPLFRNILLLNALIDLCITCYFF